MYVGSPTCANAHVPAERKKKRSVGGAYLLKAGPHNVKQHWNQHTHHDTNSCEEYNKGFSLSEMPIRVRIKMTKTVSDVPVLYISKYAWRDILVAFPNESKWNSKGLVERMAEEKKKEKSFKL